MAADGADQLVGRDVEMRALTDRVDQVRISGSAVAVVGDPGIGKSSLLRAVGGHARQAGLRVLRTEGVEAEAQMPFAGLHQLLRPVLGTADRLPAPQRKAVTAAFGISEDENPEPFMIALAALNLLAGQAARRPVLLLVDDAQWLDPPSGDVLAFIARRLASDPMVLVSAVRAGHHVPLTAAGLPALDLAGLDEASARAVLAAHGDGLGYTATERILREAEGNPLALVELPVAVRATAGSGLDLTAPALPLTARLEQAFSVRLSGLPRPAQDAMLIAAVNDSDDAQEIIAGASVLTGDPVDAGALEAAARAGLISFDGLHVRFRHPLVRSGVLQSHTLTRAYAANAALAEVLAGEPYRRVWHRAQSVSGQDDVVADELEDMHLVSLRRGSVTQAIWALERSAQLTTDSGTRGRRLMLAAEHAFGLGRADLVDQLLVKAARTRLSRLDRARMGWLREIFNDGVPGDAGRVLELCGMAAESIAAGETGLALNLLLGAALRCWWSDTGPEARARVTEVTRSLSGASGDPRYPAVLAVADPVLAGREALTIIDAVVLEDVPDPADLWLFGMAAHAAGDPVHATDFLGRAATGLRQQGRLGLLSQVLTMQVLDHLELGDWDRALTAAQEGNQLARETGQPIWDTGSRVLHSAVLALRGDTSEALAMAGGAEREAGGRRLGNLLACVQLARGCALINRGEYGQAYQELRRMFDPGDPAFHLAERFRGVTYLAEAAVHAGQADDARAIIARLEDDADTTSSPALHRHLGYARAVLAGDEADELFRAALDAGLVRWPWLRARLELARGTWLRRERRSADARQPLRSALATFEIMGAARWAEQARAELRASGERPAAGEPPRPEPAVSVSLSAQELQIARLAAEGLSNREIGERLYLSPRTIGSHLYRIFPKLHVTSRNQLAARLAAAVAPPQPSVQSAD